MSEAWEAYVADIRPVCKYGFKCYQKNSQHSSKFKHPPIKKLKKVTENSDFKRFKTLGVNKPNNSTLEVIIDDKQSLGDPETSVDNSLVNNTVTPEINVCYINLSDNPANQIAELFLCKVPTDFMEFWNFLNSLNDKPDIEMGKINLELVGPFDLLLNRLPIKENSNDYLVHWRYFYDPPEFQTVMKIMGNKSEYHYGYYRDSPDDDPVFVASNDGKSCTIIPMADNIFGAVDLYLNQQKKKSLFLAMNCKKLQESLIKWCEDHGIPLTNDNVKKRRMKIVAKTFHGAGIVVPYDKKTQLGYRNLAESDATIKKMVKKIVEAKSPAEKDKALSDFQPIITYANIAVDECDFGTGLELGIDLFCMGIEELNGVMMSTLTTAYTLLQRKKFIQILEMHVKNRRKGPNMSMMNL